ncbi:hypothetical protein ABPG72_015338 [Tetrahymena utriculariae]
MEADQLRLNNVQQFQDDKIYLKLAQQFQLNASFYFGPQQMTNSEIGWAIIYLLSKMIVVIKNISSQLLKTQTDQCLTTLYFSRFKQFLYQLQDDKGIEQQQVLIVYKQNDKDSPINLLSLLNCNDQVQGEEVNIRSQNG